jgi:hypothetical protein
MLDAIRRKKKVPGLPEFLILMLVTGLAARREGSASENHHVRRKPDGSTTFESVAYQTRVEQRVPQWVKRVAAVLRPIQEVWIRSIQEAADRLRQLKLALDENAKHIPERLVLGDLYRRLTVPVVLAEAVQVGGLWPIVDHLVLPLALLSAVAITVVSAIGAVLAGVCLAALMFNEPDTSNELSPRQRSLALLGAVGFSALVLLVSTAMAVSQDHFLLWYSISLVVVGIEGLWGASLYESRFHRERDALQNARADALKDGRMACVALNASRDAAMAAGHRAVDRGDRVLRRAQVSFERACGRRQRWRKTPYVVPSPPTSRLPGETELEQRLLVTIDRDMTDVIALFNGWPKQRIEGHLAERRLRRAA